MRSLIPNNILKWRCITWFDFRDRHNQQSKKKAGEAALKAGNHEEAHRLFSEACDVDKHNKKYRLVSIFNCSMQVFTSFDNQRFLMAFSSTFDIQQAPIERVETGTPEGD